MLLFLLAATSVAASIAVYFTQIQVRSPAASDSSQIPSTESDLPSSRPDTTAEILEVRCGSDSSISLGTTEVLAQSGGVRINAGTDAADSALHFSSVLHFAEETVQLSAGDSSHLVSLQPGKVSVSCGIGSNLGDSREFQVADPGGYWLGDRDELTCDPASSHTLPPLAARHGNSPRAALESVSTLLDKPLREIYRTPVGYLKSDEQMWNVVTPRSSEDGFMDSVDFHRFKVTQEGELYRAIYDSSCSARIIDFDGLGMSYSRANIPKPALEGTLQVGCAAGGLHISTQAIQVSPEGLRVKPDEPGDPWVLAWQYVDKPQVYNQVAIQSGQLLILDIPPGDLRMWCSISPANVSSLTVTDPVGYYMTQNLAACTSWGVIDSSVGSAFGGEPFEAVSAFVATQAGLMPKRTERNPRGFLLGRERWFDVPFLTQGVLTLKVTYVPSADQDARYVATPAFTCGKSSSLY
ncbi:hypothetical protein BJY21_003096 [Kineosphaera limosa]|uniref:hypothetical protein n=1 Tax=Kineosphaera limosa TaxID=111564 RepID=UPI0012FB13C1|nr:hypothetical protein [Kineosphaera limosa]NYE01912.1 hypothetical protein [Kineosphaera limosa]